MDLVYFWYGDRYWPKILHSAIPIPIHDFKVKVKILFTTISTPMHDLKVKVTDLELLC